LRKLAQPHESLLLVGARKPAEADNIGDQNRR
jgi:hypothetical protein